MSDAVLRCAFFAFIGVLVLVGVGGIGGTEIGVTVALAYLLGGITWGGWRESKPEREIAAQDAAERDGGEG